MSATAVNLERTPAEARSPLRWVAVAVVLAAFFSTEHHLLISPFREGKTVFRSTFPQRNRIMAVISDATVIVEASNTSGTLHQAAECQSVGRWLFIIRSVVESPGITWPGRFLVGEKTGVVSKTEDILSKIRSP